MSDMADFALDRADNEMEQYFNLQDADFQTQYDAGLIDERGVSQGGPVFGRGKSYRNSVLKHCKFCGRGGLHWVQNESGWRLAYSDGRVHGCDAHVFGESDE